MTTEELLKPRYKVIADYPGNSFEMGTILMQDLNTIGEVWVEHSRIGEKNSDRDFVLPEYIGKYPHLFRPLAWWEEREEKEIKAVKYVKDRGGRVYEILTWVIEGDVVNAGITVRPFIIHVPHLFPATESEYNEYISAKATSVSYNQK